MPLALLDARPAITVVTAAQLTAQTIWIDQCRSWLLCSLTAPAGRRAQSWQRAAALLA